MQDSNQEMREVGSAFIHLQPTDNAMIRQIFGRRGSPRCPVFGKFRLDDSPPRRAVPPRAILGMATRKVWQASTYNTG